MSQVEVDKIIPQSGTTLTIGDSGDTITIPSGATLSGSLNADNLDSGTVPDARITGAYTGITNLTMSGDLTVNGNAVIQQTTGDASLTISANENASNREPRLNLKGYNTSSNPTISFGDNAGYPAEISYENLDNSMRIRTNNGERMRIDSSGNLLVAQTATNQNVVGISLNSNGNITACRDGGISGLFNRKTSDGSIVSFRKDGTEVGSIGIESAGFYIDGEALHTGLIFTSSSVSPRDNGSATDNLTDLGNSGGRWKDLYLGGGLVIGGTGTANKLDDYEEGDWTPTLTGSGSAGSLAYNGQHGAYEKIGKLVVLTGFIQLTNKGSYTGNISIGNLPFLVAGGNKNYSGTVFYNSNLTLPANNYGAGAYPVPSNTSAIMFSQNSGGSSNLNWSAMNNNSQIGAFTIVYFTDV